MKRKAQIVAALATLPLVIYAGRLCCIDDSQNCLNVYPGAIVQHRWTCATPMGTHYVYSDFEANNQPQKRWARWVVSGGSAGYTASTVHCLATGNFKESGFHCPEHYNNYSYACSGPVWPIGTGNAEMNAWSDGTSCP